jgi:Transposase DDE domain group 1
VNDETVVGKVGKFNIAFRQNRQSSHAGAVLMQQFISQLRVATILDNEIKVKERESGFSESVYLLSIAWNLILGGECLDDLNVLRGDPGTMALIGMKELPTPRATAKFLRRFRIGDLRDLQRALRLIQESAHRHVLKWLPEAVCTIDLDSSIFEQCARKREGVKRAYNGQIGFHPLLAFWAEVGELLFSHLQSGNVYASKKAIWFMSQVLLTVPPGLQLKLRADSAFYSWKFIGFCEARGIIYAITADMTKLLRRAIQALEERLWEPYGEDPAVQVAEFRYQPTRRGEHRYVVKRVAKRDAKGVLKYAYHAIITNDETMKPATVVKWQLGRCNMENLIKEHKIGFSLEHLPNQKFFANWAYLLAGQLAFDMDAWFKYLVLPERYLTATIKTQRHHLFNLSGKIVNSGRQNFLVLSDEYLYKDVWRFAINHLDELGN